MCGIAGIVNLTGQPVDTTLLLKMNDQLRHRGPDDEGYILIRHDVASWAEYSGAGSPRAVRDAYPRLRDSINHRPFSIGLAHRRFSIVDPTPRGHQPFVDSERVCCVVFNGEIFNYVELGDELMARGHQFRSASDTEVIVEAYKAWGADCFSRFNGMWALALYDFRDKRLIVSRDRLGEIPLYWTRIGESIYFASEIKALLDVSPAPSVNEEAIHPYLVHGLQDVNGETFFDGIYSLPPATWAYLDRDFPGTGRRYWKVPEQRMGDDEMSVPETTMWLRETLQDAVRIRLRADVPWCVSLSGGLDSSVLVALAAQCTGSPVRAYTVQFPEIQWNEESFARAVARQCGVEHRVVALPLHNFWHESRPFTYLVEEPYHAPTIYARQLLYRAMRSDGFKVNLTGDGGDEFFGGYMRHFQLAQTENLLAHRFGMFLENELRWSETQTHLKPLARRLIQRLKSILRRSAWAAPADSHQRDDEASHSGAYVNRPPIKYPRRTLTEQLYDEIVSTSIPYWVRTNDRMRMGIPIEGRSPYLDYRVVELAFKLPVTCFIRHGWHKWIVRKAFEDLLPREVVWRKEKLGFPTPLRRFFSTSPPTVQLLFEQLHNPYADLPSFERFVHRTQTQHGEWHAYIERWRMTSFLLWYELFINDNQELFSRIHEEQRDTTDYVEDEVLPEFLRRDRR